MEENIFVTPRVADDIASTPSVADQLIEDIQERQEEESDEETDEAVVEETGSSTQGNGLTSTESDSQDMCTA